MIGLACMAPFMVITGLYVGPVAESLGGVDYSIFVGLPVSGCLYWLFARSLDLDTERRMVREEGLLDRLH
ncbi:hypothetical protein [Streptomyces sp. NBC_01264]|uniref:hypothetical protein n=1 Tax=Streptomyces sp. NBC_01264 TaxID=2903804 RepID=UPI00225C3CAA|nr:hypothetical protein [Streptomyces sp. NBC_01264]MCX4775966.1 hypothetical protein [Streptomyces sp. NBC_01264]